MRNELSKSYKTVTIAFYSHSTSSKQKVEKEMPEKKIVSC